MGGGGMNPNFNASSSPFAGTGTRGNLFSGSGMEGRPSLGHGSGNLPIDAAISELLGRRTSLGSSFGDGGGAMDSTSRRESLDATASVLDACILDLARRRQGGFSSASSMPNHGFSTNDMMGVPSNMNVLQRGRNTNNDLQSALSARQQQLQLQQLELETRQRELELQRQQLLAGLQDSSLQQRLQQIQGIPTDVPPSFMGSSSMGSGGFPSSMMQQMEPMGSSSMGGGGGGGGGMGMGMSTPSPTAAPINPTPSPVPGPLPERCGCFDCTLEIWETYAGEFTCGERIEWKQTIEGGGLSETDACEFVSNEFFTICGPQCRPSQCDGQCAAPPIPAPTLPPGPAVTPTSDIYCFPPYANRLRFTNAWGNYIIEAKDSQGGVCGPNTNKFTSQTISFDPTLGELTLEYKYIGGSWYAGEVRILLPEAQMPYTYGTYSFSLKTVAVKDSSDNVLSSELPDDMVLGMFTWDTSDDFALEQNHNHEVDWEISKWGYFNNQDVQFLTQPFEIQGPQFPADRRYSSGGQGGNVYEFTWNPNEIVWSAHDRSYTYSTDIALASCSEDYIQCLPNNVEVRINLWNMLDKIPDNLDDTQRVVVVFDNFSFTSSGETHVADGGSCSKHCQCSASSSCASGICVAS